VTSFGCPIILMSDHRTHFINSTVEEILEEFKIHHQKSTPYHTQENGTTESFNNILKENVGGSRMYSEGLACTVEISNNIE
jgi:transposase InsO family protein